MTEEIENEYGETNSPTEMTVYDKMRKRLLKPQDSTMLKGWSHMLPTLSDKEVVEAFAKTPQAQNLAKAIWAESLNVDTAHIEMVKSLRKAGLGTEDASKVSRTAIGDVTGGLVPKDRLPDDIEEEILRSSKQEPGTSTGTPTPPAIVSAKDRARTTGWTPQNNVEGRELNTRDTTSYTALLGKNPEPHAPGTGRYENTTWKLPTEQDRGSYAQATTYDERGKLNYSQVEQKPGQASVDYKFYQPGHPALNKRVSEPVITKPKGISIGTSETSEGTTQHIAVEKTVEPEGTYLVKHMVSALMKADEETMRTGTAVTADTVGQSMADEGEALQATLGAPQGAIQRAEEDEMDERDEEEFSRLEETADRLDMEARRAELEGDWNARDQLRETAKSYRRQAMYKMDAIKTRRGMKNFSTGI